MSDLKTLSYEAKKLLPRIPVFKKFRRNRKRKKTACSKIYSNCKESDLSTLNAKKYFRNKLANTAGSG